MNFRGIDTDDTFGIRPRFFRNRAIFKKTKSNQSGTTAIPKAESEALDLKLASRVNILAIKLDTKQAVSIRNIETNRDNDGFFNFSFPKSKAEQMGVDRANLAPMQMVMEKVGSNNLSAGVGGVNLSRGPTAADFLVWKQRVKQTPDGEKYVTIEPNERDYFNVRPGDKVSITTISLEDAGLGGHLKTFFNKSLQTTVRENSTEGTLSTRVYLGNLVDQFGHDEGTLVQCIARPL